MKPIKIEKDFLGRQLILETGRLANLAHSSVFCTYGGTQVLCTISVSDQKREGVDYLPLMVDYEEKLFAAGKIKGSRFIKREGRPTDEAVLTGRLVDRMVRPLIDSKIRNDIQIILSVLSWDRENDPDIVSLMAVSSALSISNLPLVSPLTTAVRVGIIEDKILVNPIEEETAKSILDLIISGTDKNINMLEAQAKEAEEEKIVSAAGKAQKEIKNLLFIIQEFQDKCKDLYHEKIEWLYAESELDSALQKKIDAFVKEKLDKALFVEDKKERRSSLKELGKNLLNFLGEEIGDQEKGACKIYLDQLIKQRARKSVLAENKRVDGRKGDELRPISCDIGVLVRTHGSALFNRGTTQALSVVTLGAPGLEQTLDEMHYDGKKRYFHHYNFPPYSVGEVQPLRGPGRRDIGHGDLAERAILPLLPAKEDFPYTIRVVSEILSSNGSSSMASVCGSCLSLMDAGVPIKKACAGIAMGLISDQAKNEYMILTDIQGVEDSDGDMDLKAAGTREGITAMQMDVKIEGISLEILEKALKQARKARFEILNKMEQTIAAPRSDLSPFAPRIVTIKINPEKIGEVIGPGGKMINKIIDSTGVEIDIEDSGLVMITSVDKESADKAIEWVKNITREVKVGEVFEGRVTRIMEFGAFVEVLPKQEGLIHISQLAEQRVERVGDVVKVGDIVKVKVIEIDEQGRINLSRKAMLK